MILLTDISFFKKPIEIPNLYEQNGPADEVNRFIRKYEPELLKDLLGYELYTSFQAALLVNPLSDKYQDLLFGATYTGTDSKLKQWRGIIESDTSSLSFGNGSVTFKRPEWLVVGQTVDNTSDVIIPANAYTFTVPDWIGWTPIIYRAGAAYMQPGVNYTYDIETGTVSASTDYMPFGQDERLFVQFEPQQQSESEVETVSYKHSLIADYVYFYWQRNNATFSTGIGEKKVSTTSTIDSSPGDKQVYAWNDMVDWIQELWCFLDSNRSVYTNWYGLDRRINYKYSKINVFGI